MTVFHRIPLAGLAIAPSFLLGCAGNPSLICNLKVEIQVSPASAVVNHAAAPPANQIQFSGFAVPTAPSGCPIPDWVAGIPATWSNPDPAAIRISSANDATNGTAVCIAPTNGAVTLTGTFTETLPSPVTKTVQLTCD